MSCKVTWLCSPVQQYNFIIEITGTFSETQAPEDQLHWIFENCKVVRAANGVSTIIEALKIAGRKHDLLWCELAKIIPFISN